MHEPSRKLRGDKCGVLLPKGAWVEVEVVGGHRGWGGCRVRHSPVSLQEGGGSAADAHADGHERPKRPPALHHGFPHSSHQLSAPHADPAGRGVLKADISKPGVNTF